MRPCYISSLKDAALSHQRTNL
ncbi:hypothetical protein QTG54_000468 [Skeletonema marinoi]|uniref:Uncharacterized protein n=1 Tax=Skeletonema marinoi TaxID=267567 RepID=A0AAD9DJK9_9STRA|nr:hypothetical protein QTG54_000468 [Skeletonema marinoi]